MLKFILGVIFTIIFGYFVVTGLQEYFANQEEIRKAEKELEIAQKEYLAAEQEIDDILAGKR
jgi:uncharacterized membrane protein (DUF106 family)